MSLVTFQDTKNDKSNTDTSSKKKPWYTKTITDKNERKNEHLGWELTIKTGCKKSN